MKKLMAVLMAVFALSLVTPVMATGEKKVRVVITEDDAASLATLKVKHGVHHDFGNVFSTHLTETQIADLSKDGVKIKKVEEVYLDAAGGKPGKPDRPGKPDPTPECDPDNQKPWGIVKVNGGSGGDGITVAVLDTGVQTSHPDLKDNIVDCVDVTGRKPRSRCSDSNGHGTHVAGTVAASGKILGVAPDANIMAIKVGSSRFFTDDIVAGFMYAADNGADIITMSISGPKQDLFEYGVNYAASAGVLMTMSAGNYGPDEGTMRYPAAYVKVMGIGAIDSSDDVADFSSRGVNDGDWTIEEMEIDMVGPGVSVESTYNDGCYYYMSGTSMSTPHIAGLAAKLWQGNAGDTRTYLQTLAKNYDIDATGDDPAGGFGLPVAPSA